MHFWAAAKRRIFPKHRHRSCVVACVICISSRARSCARSAASCSRRRTRDSSTSFAIATFASRSSAFARRQHSAPLLGAPRVRQLFAISLRFPGPLQQSRTAPAGREKDARNVRVRITCASGEAFVFDFVYASRGPRSVCGFRLMFADRLLYFPPLLRRFPCCVCELFLFILFSFLSHFAIAICLGRLFIFLLARLIALFPIDSDYVRTPFARNATGKNMKAKAKQRNAKNPIGFSHKYYEYLLYLSNSFVRMFSVRYKPFFVCCGTANIDMSVLLRRSVPETLAVWFSWASPFAARSMKWSPVGAAGEHRDRAAINSARIGRERDEVVNIEEISPRLGLARVQLMRRAALFSPRVLPPRVENLSAHMVPSFRASSPKVKVSGCRSPHQIRPITIKINKYPGARGGGAAVVDRVPLTRKSLFIMHKVNCFSSDITPVIMRHISVRLLTRRKG